MKRISIIVMTLALLATLTQCKKEQNAQTIEGETVAITLDIKGNGTRMDVNTVTGEVTYQNGDVIYVASGGKYIGTLTYNGTNFSGGITDPTVGEPLHFYFLGNVTPAETLSAGITTSCSVVISDQTEHLPVIEYAPSNENYDSGTTTYTAMLLNKCALVKFNVTTSSEVATCIIGMYNKVMVDFSQNILTPSQEGAGIIKLAAGSGEKWAILLPQEAVEAGEDGSAYSEDEEYTGTRGTVPVITENGYLTAGIEVNITNQGGTPSGNPQGAINGLFTINANGDQIYFSQGNLQYQASTNIWRFAENQWDYVGSDNANISSTYEGWIDLFGWGTSGYDHGAETYQPWSSNTSFYNYYAYANPTWNLYDGNGQADWGYNPIINGGNTTNQWRTLTSSEWSYVFNTRNTTSGIRYAKAKVNEEYGVIILPDEWDPSIYALNSTNMPGASYTTNVINSTGWVRFLEKNGAVFIPDAGWRTGISYNKSSSYSWSGCYWSASCKDSYYVNSVQFYTGGLATDNCWDNRYYGFSVRLVRDAE